MSGRVVRDEALIRVRQAAPRVWLDDARQAIEGLCATRDFWSSDDVWAVVGQPPEPRALGSVVKHLADRDLIRPTGRYVPSVRGVCHARPVREWRRAGRRRMDRRRGVQVLAVLAAKYAETDDDEFGVAA